MERKANRKRKTAYNKYKSDNELNNAIRKFNRKRERIIRKNKEAVEYLPEKKTVRQVKELIGNKRDRNKILRQLNAFMKADAEKKYITKQGVVTTKWQIDVLREQTKAINRKRRERKKELAEQKANLPYHTDTLKQLSLEPRKLTAYEYKQKAHWNEFLRRSEEEFSSRFRDITDERYKQNYIKALGVDETLPDFNTSKIAELIESLPASVVVKAMETNPNLELSYQYSFEEQEIKYMEILEGWQEIYNEYNKS